MEYKYSVICIVAMQFFRSSFVTYLNLLWQINALLTYLQSVFKTKMKQYI